MFPQSSNTEIQDVRKFQLSAAVGTIDQSSNHMIWKLGDVASLGLSHRRVTEVKLRSLCSAFNHALIESFIKEVLLYSD